MIDENLQRQLAGIQAQQASKWLETLRAPTDQQRVEFVSWLKASPHNVREMLVMLELDAQCDDIDRVRTHDLARLIEDVRSTTVVPLKGGLRGNRDRSERRIGSRWWAAAAGLAALALYWLVAPPMTGGWKTYSTVIGEQRAFELADGSIVNLNTHSRIAVHFSSGAREIELLQGEALFRVRHDASRPFRVKTTDAVVQAVGTQFNVYARGDATLVSVVEGKVAITSVSDLPRFATGGGSDGSGGRTDGQSTHSLTENQKAQIGKNGEVMIQAVPDVSEAIAWRERRLVFRSDSLEHIVQEFNRYNRKQMRLEAGSDATRQYSGVFDADDPQAFLQVLAKDQTLEVRAIEPDYVITSR